MKIEIIPTILVESFEEVKERIKMVEDYVNWVQLDIMDGVFVNNETWDNPEDLQKIKTRLKLEAHLMVEKPEKIVDEWLKYVDRIIIHFESKITNRESGLRELIKKTHKAGKQIGIALNPETDIAAAIPFLEDLDLVLIMTVQPGWGGQEFKDWTLDKIKVLRKLWPNGNIEVDGGINPETAKKTIKAGANLICAGTYVFKSKNVKKAIEMLGGSTSPS